MMEDYVDAKQKFRTRQIYSKNIVSWSFLTKSQILSLNFSDFFVKSLYFVLWFDIPPS